MTDLLERKTGDTTYKDRVARYEYVMQRLADSPKPTYTQIGKELGGLSRQNISRLVGRGTVRPAGRQPTNEGRKRAIQKRVDRWQTKLAAAVTDKQRETANHWIGELTSRIEALD